MRQAAMARDDRIVIAGLVVFALLFRLATIMMINTGVDERDYWQSARAISQGLPYPELSHRTTRYAVILPVAAAQSVLGIHPNVYYVMPVLNCMLQAGLAYALGFRLRGRITGFMAALALILFPYMIRGGSQVRPEVFSITYMLLVLRYFVQYMDQGNQRFRPLLWATLWMFVAYETKITNLFLVPGLFLAILLYKRRPRHAWMMAGLLFGLFLVETALYAGLTPYRLGELEIITQKHFHTDSFTVPRLIDLLQRYAPDNLQPYWSVPFVIFGAGSIWYLVKGRDRGVKGLILGALSFFFFITIAVKGLHPITPAESFINRYFSVVLVPVFLTLAFLAEGALRRFPGTGRALRLIGAPSTFLVVLALGAFGVGIVFSLPILPDRLRLYAHSPFDPAAHPFALNERYRLMINQAYADGVPIVSSKGLAGSSALQTCAAFFLDIDKFIDGRAPEPIPVFCSGSQYLCLSVNGDIKSHPSVIVARRLPFRLDLVEVGDLPAVATEPTAKTDEQE